MSEEDTNRSRSAQEAVSGAAGAADEGDAGAADPHAEDPEDLGEWQDVELVVSRDEVETMCQMWKVKEKPVLDESCFLL